MEVNALACAAAGGGGDRDVDGAFEGLEKLPEDRGGLVAQNRALAAGENSGHEAGTVTGSAVAHGVDAAMDAMKPPVSRAFGDPHSPDSRNRELLRGHYSVLPRRDPRHLGVGGVAFVRHSHTKATGRWTLPLPCCFFALFGAPETAKRSW